MGLDLNWQLNFVLIVQLQSAAALIVMMIQVSSFVMNVLHLSCQQLMDSHVSLRSSTVNLLTSIHRNVLSVIKGSATLQTKPFVNLVRKSQESLDALRVLRH